MHYSSMLLLLSSVIGTASVKPHTEPSSKNKGPGHRSVVCSPVQAATEMPNLCHVHERFSNRSSGATRGLGEPVGCCVQHLQNNTEGHGRKVVQETSILVKCSGDQVRKTITKDSRDTRVPTQN